MVKKTNISKIMWYVVNKVKEMGFNVTISCSKKTRTRYLEIELAKGRIVKIRISDHASNKGDYRFDIHTTKRRKGSVDYMEFIDIFTQIVGV